MTQAQAPQGGNTDIEKSAPHIFEQVIAAHEEVDYSKLAPWLSAEMSEALDEATFESIIAEHLAALGDFSGADYLGSLQKGDATQLLWRTRYSESETEVLWQLFLAPQDGQLKIVGMLFS
ncbi:MAG: hypothetical protein EOO54_20955 [Haliea sp.]|nr:MAG: hypothetical protein EOO54_20955 [Haliea sp.]